ATALAAKRRPLQREAELLKELLAVRGAYDGTGADERGEGAARARTKLHPAVGASIEELDRSGRPLHISELMRLLSDRGVEIPGSGQQANLIAHLTRAPEI